MDEFPLDGVFADNNAISSGSSYSTTRDAAQGGMIREFCRQRRVKESQFCSQ